MDKTYLVRYTDSTGTTEDYRDGRSREEVRRVFKGLYPKVTIRTVTEVR